MKTIKKNKHIKKIRSPYLENEDLKLWDKDLIIASILELNSIEPVTTVKMFGVNRAPKADPTLSKFNNQPTSRKFLHFASCHYFGSWNTALRASGLDPVRYAPTKFWNKTKIVTCIKALNDNGHPLTVKATWRDRSRKSSRILEEACGKATTTPPRTLGESMSPKRLNCFNVF